MYCTRCGEPNDDSALRCVKCQEPTASPGDALRGHPEIPDHVPNYLVQAILVTLFCCLPFGIVAIVYAAQVNGKLEAGDYAGAMAASKNAKIWSWVSFGVGLAGGLAYFALFAASLGSMGR